MKVAAKIVAGYVRGTSFTTANQYHAALSGRETEVLLLVVDGNSNRYIADRLSISVKTVEAHRAAIMRKLHIQSIPELVRYAIRAGLVDL